MVMAWASLKLNDFGQAPALSDRRRSCWPASSWSTSTSSTRDHLAHGEGPCAQHVSGDLLHADRPARPAHPRRDGRDGVFPRPGREDVEDEAGAVHQPDRVHRALLALRRSGLDLPVPGVVSCCRPAETAPTTAWPTFRRSGDRMHSDPAAVKKSVRTYLMIGAALLRVHGHHGRGRTRCTSPCRWRSPSRSSSRASRGRWSPPCSCT